jgi:hypothetical protein
LKSCSALALALAFWLFWLWLFWSAGSSGSAGLLVCWYAGLLVCWSAGLLVCWSAGLLVGWSAGLLVGWSAGRSQNSFSWMQNRVQVVRNICDKLKLLLLMASGTIKETKSHLKNHVIREKAVLSENSIFL